MENQNQNQKKYVSLDGLGTFLDNLNVNFAPLTHNHTTSDITDYQVDDTFSDTSTNSVQNKVLTAKFNDVGGDIQTLSDTINALNICNGSIDGAINQENASANGKNSSAFGLKTTAQGDNQHVYGAYNIIDTDSPTKEGDIFTTRYAHIVGNGTDENNKSNAHTLDWEGNAWFAGDVYVGGNSQDVESKRLVTEEKINIIGSKGYEATVGLSFVSNNDGTCRVVGFNDEYDDNIVNIVIPCISPNGDIVTSIEESAFEGCDSLENMLLPDSITSIGDWAFYECYSLTSVTIPNSVTSIGDGAFASCSSLTSVIIPDSVTSIGGSAFSNCTSLTSVTIGNGVTSISNSAFYYCYNLTNINISDKVTSIGDSAFNGCESLTDITIGNGVTSIGSAAFQGCENLTSIIIPKNVTTIDSIPFDGCSNLTAIYCEVESRPDNWSGEWNEGVDCPIYWGVKYDVPASFNKHEVDNEGNAWFAGDVYVGGNSQDDTSAKKLVTEDYVKAAIDVHHPYSKGLTYSRANNEDYYSVTGIGTCKDTTIVIPSIYNNLPVIEIGMNAFDNCTSLTSIVIPDRVTSIGNSAFFNCTSLTSVTIGNGVTSIGNGAFDGCSSLTSVTIGNSVTSIGDYAFESCTSLTSITIPDSVTSIGDFAFNGCSKLTSVTIGNCVTSIGSWAFQTCENLKSITIPYGVTSIGKSAFFACYRLTSITIPEGVTRIGESAFYYCGFTSVTIPNSVTSIGKEAFHGSSNLTIYCEAESKPEGWDENWKTDSCSVYWGVDNKKFVTINEVLGEFDSSGVYNTKGVDNNTTDSILAYQIEVDSQQPTVFKKGISIGENAEVAINDRGIAAPIIMAFSYDENNNINRDTMTVISVDEGILSPSICVGDNKATIDNDGNISATSLNIGENISIDNDGIIVNGQNVITTQTVEKVNYYLQDISTGLAFVSNGDGTCYVSGIGDCTDTDIVIPSVSPDGDSVTSIGEYAFFYCTSLTSVTIPDGVTSIGVRAFDGCTSLTSVIIPNSVTSIGAYAFYGCTSLINATIGKSVTSIGNYAFYECSNLTSVTIPNGVTSIGNYAFYGCTSLTSVTIPKSVTSIGDYAFMYCTNLTNINIPDGVISIGNYAFNGCFGLTSVIIPDSVETIGSSAFATSLCLRKIYCEASSKPDDWQENWNENNDSVVVWGISLNDINDEKIARINLDLDTAHSAMSGYDIDNGTVEERLYQLSQNQMLPNAAMSGYDTTKGTIEERLNKLGFSESSVSSLAYKGDGATLTVNKIQKQGNMVFGELKIDYSQCTAIVSCSDGKGAVNYTQNNVPFTVTSAFPSGYAPQSTNKSFIVPCMINDSTNKPIQGHCTATLTISRSLEVTNFMINDTKPNKVNIREIDILFWYDITK